MVSRDCDSLIQPERPAQVVSAPSGDCQGIVMGALERRLAFRTHPLDLRVCSKRSAEARTPTLSTGIHPPRRH